MNISRYITEKKRLSLGLKRFAIISVLFFWLLAESASDWSCFVGFKAS